MRGMAMALFLLAGCAAPGPGMEPDRICPDTNLAGTVEQVQGGSLVLNATEGWNGTLVVRFTQTTRWWDLRADGCHAGEVGVAAGQRVRSDGGERMTRSLPPQATADNVVRLP